MNTTIIFGCTAAWFLFCFCCMDTRGGTLFQVFLWKMVPFVLLLVYSVLFMAEIGVIPALS